MPSMTLTKLKNSYMKALKYAHRDVIGYSAKGIIHFGSHTMLKSLVGKISKVAYRASLHQ